MKRYLYLAGTSFTGSTLASFLLNLHPEIVSVGEATGPLRRWHDRREYPCSCGVTLAECPFWTEVGEEMAKRGLDFDPEHWDMRLDPDNVIARRLITSSLRSNRADRARDAVVSHVPVLGKRMRLVARRNEALADSACSVAGASVFADASKSVNRARMLDRMTDLEPYVVHLVRDSLGFVASKKSRSEKNPRGAQVGNATRYWNRRSEQADVLFASLPAERRLRVRYEDLCSDPEREFGRICEFLGLKALPGPYDFRAGSHHIIGNRMRLASSSEIVLDERWRSILTEEEVETVRQSTRPYRELYGYADDPSQTADSPEAEGLSNV